MDIFLDKYHGCLLGLCVGDALGGPLEFMDRDTMVPYNQMEYNYLYDLPAGCWTEKSGQAFCTAIVICVHGEFSCTNFLKYYHGLITKGHLAPFDKPFEPTIYMKITGLKIGLLLKYRRSIPKMVNPYDLHQVDCEPIFRVAPIVLTYYAEPLECMQHINDLTKLTHASPICTDACKFLAALLIGALMGISKDYLLSENFNVMDAYTYGPTKYSKYKDKNVSNCYDIKLMSDIIQEGDNENEELQSKNKNRRNFINEYVPPILALQKGHYKYKQREDIKSDNHIVNCLEAALWTFHRTNNFEKGLTMAINLGNSTNSVGAIYGQLAGIYYGFNQIPNEWISKLYRFKHIADISRRLSEAAGDILGINMSTSELLPPSFKTQMGTN